MILRLVRFILKLAAGIVIGGILIFAIIKGTTDYLKNPDGPYDDVTYMIKSYGKNEEVPQGTWCQCPVCDKYFYKDDVPCCSHDCEEVYWEIVAAWDDAQPEKSLIEKYGKKFN